ncbi:hypothetical protein CI109_105027 [Kwoniella shandongensis]|uniref:Uncharacterized protein n=1 Tax=Kwoniella shandongensis TaxID=1734106 RepID=A0A5M6BWU7_9TREE|nr:uncharacterized protein CI109_004374 [Kwoniella shandongensis]KAA5527314.1 hypothetical protein CI109_004374 [Kwoniella shandongensis]
MSSPFPQLLRRANIATYDPLITRIYTSTPSSKSQHSDWGLKYAIHLPKGPRYIKFSSLDAGPGFKCDWRSGEREARFVSAWGGPSGKVRWQNEDEIPKYMTKTQSIFDVESLVEDEEPASEGSETWIRDVESMSEEEFESFLERVREQRGRFLNGRLEDMPESTKSSLGLPEDKTLVHLATAGKTTGGATANFQAQLTADDLIDPHSNQLHSKPHRVHGLSYSKQPTSSNDHNPSTRVVGRALNKLSRYDDAQRKASNIGQGGSLARSGNNLPWVVGLGGLTAKTGTKSSRIFDSSSSSDAGLEETDYTRLDRSKGVGKFRVTRAQLGAPPSVLALNQSLAGGKFGGKWRTSGATLPSPMDTFKFDIEVAPSSETELLGGREWVGREVKTSKISTFTSEMGLGGPRSQRRKGEALEKLKENRLREREAKEETRERLANLFARIGKSNAGARGGQ